MYRLVVLLAVISMATVDALRCHMEVCGMKWEEERFGHNYCMTSLYADIGSGLQQQHTSSLSFQNTFTAI